MPERTAPSASARKRIVQASTTAAAEPVISSPVETPNHARDKRVDRVVEARQREQQAEADDRRRAARSRPRRAGPSPASWRERDSRTALIRNSASPTVSTAAALPSARCSGRRRRAPARRPGRGGATHSGRTRTAECRSRRAPAASRRRPAAARHGPLSATRCGRVFMCVPRAAWKRCLRRALLSAASSRSTSTSITSAICAPPSRLPRLSQVE